MSNPTFTQLDILSLCGMRNGVSREKIVITKQGTIILEEASEQGKYEADSRRVT